MFVDGSFIHARRLRLFVLLLLIVAALVTVAGFAFLTQRVDKGPELPGNGTLGHRICGYFPRYGAELECFWYRTPEGFRLPVAVFSHEDNRHPDPLLYLAGGPGESRNTDPAGLAFWNSWYNNAQLDRDLIIFDYRGAATGEPTWECRSFIELSKQGMQMQSMLEESHRKALNELGRCVEQWDESLRQHLSVPISAGKTSRLFTSAHNARDANDIASALGYVQWNLLGVSYGTRVALISALTEPAVRRLILDSPYPLEAGDLVENTRVWIEAFEDYWRQCDSGNVCPEPAGGTEEAFWEAMEQLRRSPLTVSVDDWYSDGQVEILVDDIKFMHALYSAMHSQESITKIRPLIDDVLMGREIGNIELFEYFYNFSFDPAFNAMLYFATECVDNRRVSENDFNALIAGSGRWQRYMDLDWRYDICRHEYLEPIPLPAMEQIEIPALVVVGERDPVTPARHARALAAHLSRGLALHLPDRSHAEFFNDDCGFELIAWFLNAPVERITQPSLPASPACR